MSKTPLPQPAAPAWRRLGRAAETMPAACAGFAGMARVDLAAPSQGLTTSDGDRLLGLDLGSDGEATDAWIRGADLTACWEPQDDRGLRATALWRCHCDGSRLTLPPDVLAWELIASATSRRLHADATLTVTADVAATAVLAAAFAGDRPASFTPPGDPRQAVFMIRRDGPTSVALVVHPGDRHATTVTTASHRARFGCRLFASGVEKGVLLRSRVLAALGPAAGDVAWITSLAERFAALPPELST